LRWSSTTGKKGRVLSRDIDALGLVAGDRLEPTFALPDIMQFDHVTVFPTLVLFWRSPPHPAVHHRHPLLDPELHIGLHSFALDALHDMHLGVFAEYCSRVASLCLLSDVWDTGYTRKQELLMGGVKFMKAELWDWYRRYRPTLSESQRRGFTKVNTLKLAMLGLSDRGAWSCKAAETRHLLPFFVYLAEKFSSRLRDSVNITALIRAGAALVEYTDVLARESRKVSSSAYTRLCTLCRQHNCDAVEAGIAMKPKHHLFVHLTDSIQAKGNPRYYSTYMDESMNKLAATIAASAHRHAFERRTFAKFAMAQHSVIDKDKSTWW
jgi:hypothetical protein